MGRLIDADTFKNQLIREPWTDYSKEAVLRMIDNQSTAFDVDKVIQDLKDHSYKANEWNDETQSFDLPVIELDLAVRLVKGAVKDE